MKHIIYLVHTAMVSLIINALRKRKGLETLPVQFRYRQYKESEFDRLADTVRKHFDMKKFYEVLG